MANTKEAISITLDTEVEYEIRQLAKAHKRSVSGMINLILAERLGFVKLNNEVKEDE
jgi:hypothetical protein